MRSILLSLFVYALVIGVHLLVCRFQLPRKQQVSLLWLLGILGAILYWSLAAAPAGNPSDIWSLSLRKSVLVFYLLLLFPYYIFFTNADYDSPSQMIMRLLNKRGRCSYAELLQAMTPEALINARLNDLAAEGFIGEHGGQYFLKAKGMWLVKFMGIYKMILGREING